MTTLINTKGCGNTIRSNTVQSDKAISNNTNTAITKATSGSLDYTKGQPQYAGNARCDPARDGTDQPKCCKGK